MSLDKLSRSDLQIGGAGILLFISLLFFPWWDISILGHSITASGTSDPDGWLGIISLLAVIALIADLGIERFAPHIEIPPVGGGREATRFLLAGLVAVLLVVKFLVNIHFSDFGWGFYLDVIVTAALVYFTLEARTLHT